MYVILLEHDNYAPLTCSPGMYSYISLFYMYIFLQILWNKLLSIVFQKNNKKINN